MVRKLFVVLFFLLSSLGCSVMLIGLFFKFINMAMIGFIGMWFSMYVLLKLEGVR